MFDPGSPTSVTYHDHHAAVFALDFDPKNPRRFASGGYDGILRLWSVTNHGTPLIRRNDLPKAIRGVAFNPKGTLLAVAKDNSTVQVWTV